jgi:hypothetical protein
MKAPRLFLCLLISATVTITSSCTNWLNDLTGGGSPNKPSTTSTTDSFNGTLAPNGSLVFTFSVATAGSIAVTLTAVSPPTTAPLGLGIGPSSNGDCTIANSTSGATAGANSQLSGTENPGNYCVKVSDAGSLSATSTVTVTVMHP